MTGDHGNTFTQHNSKDVPQFAPNFTVYVLPPDVVCLYSEDRKFFLHGELYCALSSAIGKGGKSLPQRVRELRQAFSAFSYRRGEGAIKLAVKKELPVLGIEAYDVGRQHIDREIRRELRNVVAGVPRRAGLAILRHDVSTRATLPKTLVRRCKAYSPTTGITSSSSRRGISR